LLGVLVLASTNAIGQTQDTCRNGIAAVSAAIAAHQIETARTAYNASVLPVCLGPEQPVVARRLALAHLDALDAAEASGASVASRIELVRQGLRIDSDTWQLREAEGDLLQILRGEDGNPDFAAASADYQVALNVMHSLRPGEKPPNTDDFQRLVAKAEQTRLLARQLVGLPTGRDGKPGGLALGNLRGLGVTHVAQPIEFETNTDHMTPLGEEAARQLLESLRSEGPPGVRLVGHTDERGSDEHNDRLSLARARAVVRFLEANGFPPGKAAAEGRGKHEPFHVVQVDGVTYTQEQRWQMDRRVELVQ
jgi:outer membrane protein OmpA-like peptidoglycan-associated protein